jgi:hypothetical protein
VGVELHPSPGGGRKESLRSSIGCSGFDSDIERCSVAQPVSSMPANNIVDAKSERVFISIPSPGVLQINNLLVFNTSDLEIKNIVATAPTPNSLRIVIV